MQKIPLVIEYAEIGLVMLWDNSIAIFRPLASFGFDPNIISKLGLRAGESITGKVFDQGVAQILCSGYFFNAFSLTPKGKHCIHVCMGTACHVRGSRSVLDRLQTKLGIKPGETTPDFLYTLETVNCLGACALGPNVVTDENYSGAMSSIKVNQLLKNLSHLEKLER